jgi:hypothetical protein
LTDLYRVLQVDPSADAEVVEAAYRRLARKFHPDVSARADAEARIRELNSAYEVLGDAGRRAAYDARRARRARTPVRIVEPARGPVAADRSQPAAAAPRRVEPPMLRRPVLAATAAGLAASVAVAALSAELFSAATIDRGAAEPPGVVVVSSPREAPAMFEPAPRRATATPSGWPPPIYVVAGAEAAAPPRPAVDVFTRLVGAARRVTGRLQGPTPPDRPYNPTPP